MSRIRIVLLAAVLLFGACSASVSPDAGGAEIYELVCARCHGADLEGGLGPALGAGSAAAANGHDYYLQTISRGRGRMPAFGSSLSDEQIELVISYLREQQGS